MKKFLFTACLSIILCKGEAQQITTYAPELKRINEIDLPYTKAQAPLIGLSANHQNGGSSVSAPYIQAIIEAGGIPVIIPAITDKQILNEIVTRLDGLVLTGGADINPLWYNEQPLPQLQAVDPVRDLYEFKLLKLATDRNIPVLGICRGEQLINVAFGGTLYQDIPSQRKEAIKHVQSMPRELAAHTATVVPQTQLASILGEETVLINSFHHQAVKDLAPGFHATAYSADGVIEAIEALPERPIIAVQWHPEGMIAGGDTTMLKIVSFLVEKADTFRQNKENKK